MKLTTKKTSTSSLIMGIIISAIIICAGFYFQTLADKAHSLWQFDNEDMLRMAARLLFIGAAVELYSTFCGFLSYADVYDHKICGKGLYLYGYAITDFDLDFNQISEISTSLGGFKIKTDTRTLSIVTTPARAKEIIYHFNERKNSTHP